MSMFSGSIPALVTPFAGDGVDEAAFRRLVDWQILEGSSALVPCGTTGEAPTLTNDEQHRLFAVCVEAAAGRVPVIAGCGSNDTQTALWHMQEAKALGADAALMVAPYYNRPSQAGLLAHFSYLAERVDLPIVLYNVPGRTVTDIKPETVIELARRFPDRIIGIKDASGDMTRLTAHRLALGTGFVQLCGNDDMALHYNAGGGTGCISVTANVAPRLCAEFQAASLAGDTGKAHALNERLFPLHQALFTDASPGPVKYALTRVCDWLSEEVRLPLVPCSAEARRAVDAGLAHAGLI
jgi:4-hydroxy-tetrahydrodipicolinate synthase